MKIRNGFVSNSSSSSFLICLRKDTEGKNEEIFKYVLELASTCNQKIASKTVGEERKQLQEEVKKLKRDLTFQEKRNAVLKEYAGDKAFRKKLQALDEALSLVDSSIHWKVKDMVRTAREVKADKEWKAWYEDMDPVGEALDRSQHAVDDIAPEILRIEEKLKKMEEFEDDQVMYSFEEDHSFGSGIKRAVLKMVEDGKAVMVERIDS
jgi:hypothetical protein